MKHARLFILLLLLVLSAAPTLAQQPLDTDGDGIPDTRDQCPTVAGVPELNGCPFLTIVVTPPSRPVDSDNDGIPDSDDACPSEPGPRENRGCPVTRNPPPSGPAPIIDTDGDGINDIDDLCALIPGTRENRGCPSETPPTNPNPNVETPGQNLTAPGIVTPTPTGPPPPPFTPAVLPNDGCWVTPNVDALVNIRNAPDTAAPVLGHMAPGTVYPAHGYIVLGTDIWFVVTDYQGSTGTIGYGSRSVLTATSCPRLPYTDANAQEGAFPGRVNVTTVPAQGGENPTIEYCVYVEVQEYGVFQQVCYEVEVPEGCVVTSTEAGVFTVDCGAGTVSVSPPFDDLPAEGVTVPTQQGFVIGVSLVFSQGTTRNNPVIEYCTYEPGAEAGVLVEVCHEIEVPEGCWLRSAEAGVYVIECRPEIGGEATFTFNPPSTTEPTAHPNWQELIDDLLACQPGQVWWVNFREPAPGTTNCTNPFEEAEQIERPDGSTYLVGVVPGDDPVEVKMPFEVWSELVAQFCEPDDYWAAEDEEGNQTGGCILDTDAAQQGPQLQLGFAVRPNGPQPAIQTLVAPQGSGGELENDLTPGHFCEEGKEVYPIWEEDADGNIIPGSIVIECLDPDFWD